MDEVTVIKLDPQRREKWRYSGQVLRRSPGAMLIEALFNRDDFVFHGMPFKRDDRFVEVYYADRWYNIFEIYDRDDGSLKGWYCNVTCPAEIEEGEIRYIDLALDLLVFADGRQVVLDEDEFAALELEEGMRAQARQALEDLKRLVRPGLNLSATMEENPRFPIHFEIHEIHTDNFPAVINLLEEGDDYHREALPELYRPVQPAWTEEFLKSFIGSDDARIFVAVAEGIVIGMVQFSVIRTPERSTMFSRELVFIDSLIVRSEHRRRGVGKALMSFVHGWAAERDIHSIELTVYGFNETAIRLYEELGYETMMRRMRYKG